MHEEQAQEAQVIIAFLAALGEDAVKVKGRDRPDPVDYQCYLCGWCGGSNVLGKRCDRGGGDK